MNGIDIRKMILDMRKHRMGLIQTADQLRFSYLAIIEGGKRILNKEQLSR
jgi:protein tyrosine phosphatase